MGMAQYIPNISANANIWGLNIGTYQYVADCFYYRPNI